MSRGYIGRESDGLGRGIYTPPIPLLVERRGSHTSGMNDTLEVKVYEELPPINRLRKPSYEFFRRLNMYIRLYEQAIENGITDFTSRTKGQLDSAFEQIKLRMKKGYKESLFSVLEERYRKLFKSGEDITERI